jgi:hypothetical protein
MSNNKLIKNKTILKNTLTKESTLLMYGANNLERLKCELYGDYLKSLFILDQLNHFKWCWNKNKNNFKNEGYYIDNFKLFSYFLNYTTQTFYKVMDKDNNQETIDRIFMLWEHIYDWDKLKRKVDVDELIKTYKMFEDARVIMKFM